MEGLSIDATVLSPNCEPSQLADENMVNVLMKDHGFAGNPGYPFKLRVMADVLPLIHNLFLFEVYLACHRWYSARFLKMMT